MAILGEEVEDLGLDGCRIHGEPLQVVALEFGIGRLLGLEGDGPDGGGSIDGLLGAGDIRQPILEEEGSVSWLSIPKHSNDWGFSYVCLAQLNMVGEREDGRTELDGGSFSLSKTWGNSGGGW